MLTGRLAFTLLFNAAVALVLLRVAMELRRRHVAGEAGRANLMFALWWGALGLDTLLNGLTWLAGALDLDTPLVVGALTYAALTTIVLFAWGLTYYLVYVITGKARAFWPIAAFYALSWIGFMALIISLGPNGVRMGAWAGEVAYVNEPPPIAELLVALYFLTPPLLGAIVYGLVALRVRERGPRYRILAVSIGVFVWFTASLVTTGADIRGDAAVIVGRALGLACMLLILSAYFTPAWLAARLEGPGHPARALLDAERERRRAESLERIRRLV